MLSFFFIFSLPFSREPNRLGFKKKKKKKPTYFGEENHGAELRSDLPDEASVGDEFRITVKLSLSCASLESQSRA